MLGFTKDSEQEKEEASSLMEQVASVYRVNSRASMALSTSMDPFLNISKPWKCTSTISNTFYKALSLVLGLLYIKSCNFLGKQVQVVAFKRFLLILLMKIFEKKGGTPDEFALTCMAAWGLVPLPKKNPWAL